MKASMAAMVKAADRVQEELVEVLKDLDIRAKEALLASYIFWQMWHKWVWYVEEIRKDGKRRPESSRRKGGKAPHARNAKVTAKNDEKQEKA